MGLRPAEQSTDRRQVDLQQLAQLRPGARQSLLHERHDRPALTSYHPGVQRDVAAAWAPRL